MISKQCTRCSVTKPIEEFHKNSSGKYGRSQKCAPCARLSTKEYVKANYNKVYASKYKTTETEISRVLSKTNCEICKQDLRSIKRVIDHNHSTNTIRGLLCDNCNKAIGLFRDSPAILENAIKYLKYYD